MKQYTQMFHFLEHFHVMDVTFLHMLDEFSTRLTDTDRVKSDAIKEVRERSYMLDEMLTANEHLPITSPSSAHHVPPAISSKSRRAVLYT